MHSPFVHSLFKPLTENFSSASACLEYIEETNNVYLNAKRSGGDANAIVSAKLDAVYWRSRLLNTIMQKAPDWNEKDKVLEVLLALDVYITKEQQPVTRDLIGDRRGFARLMASQGHPDPEHAEFDLMAGPGVDLNIIANRSSSWSFEKWRSDQRFCRYLFEDGGVRYRNVLFKPGDVLLANVNLNGNGVYTSLSDPRGFSSHSAFFAILEHQGTSFPVVIETFEKGVRPVPLSVFLGPRFCSYVEVYRHTELSGIHETIVNKSAKILIDQTRGYNFDTEDFDQNYVSCTGLGRQLHRDAGLLPADTLSKISHPNIQRNLAKLGYTYFEFFAPIDYLLSERFRCVGWIDNNQISSLLARDLIDVEFKRQFSERVIEPDQFPFPYSINRWGISHIRSQDLIGKIISLVEGFDDKNLPKGPDDLLAVITLVEKQIGAVIVRTQSAIEEELAKSDPDSVAALVARENVKRKVAELDLPWLRKKWYPES